MKKDIIRITDECPDCELDASLGLCDVHAEEFSSEEITEAIMDLITGKTLFIRKVI